MASEVDIGNLALSHLGDRANITSIDPPEGSAQADHVARHYPLARDTALTLYDWDFSTTRRTLAASSSPVEGWAYAYALPSDALTVFEVLEADALPGWYYGADYRPRVPFELEADDVTGLTLVLTNLDAAAIRFSRRITDTNRYSPLFVDALSWLLASKLAGPVLKGEAARKAALLCYQQFEKLLAQAATRNANQQARGLKFVPSSVRARNGGSDATIELDRYSRTEPWSAYPDGLPRL